MCADESRENCPGEAGQETPRDPNDLYDLISFYATNEKASRIGKPLATLVGNPASFNDQYRRPPSRKQHVDGLHRDCFIPIRVENSYTWSIWLYLPEIHVKTYRPCFSRIQSTYKSTKFRCSLTRCQKLKCPRCRY